jgi:hypothetical protein
MKSKIIYTFIVTGVLLTGSAFAQTSSGGTAVHVAPVPAAPRNGIVPIAPRPPQPGVTQPAQNGVNGQKTFTANTQTTSNSPSDTNGLAGMTNSAPTNNFAGTNGLGGTNNVTAVVTPLTNFVNPATSNFNGNIVMQDQAVTPSDRVLLTTLSQGVRVTLGITPNGGIPVHFLINNGTVTVVGTVQSSAQSQAVLSQVQQTPGVLSVVNDMHVAGAFAPAVQNQSGSLAFGAQTDHAFSAADQKLLTTVQQEAALQLGVNSLSQMPVHFSIQNGVVGVTGRVNSLQEKQALLAAISRTVGITRVVDNVTFTPSQAGFSGLNNGLLTPTGATNVGVNTNASGF